MTLTIADDLSTYSTDALRAAEDQLNAARHDAIHARDDARRRILAVGESAAGGGETPTLASSLATVRRFAANTSLVDSVRIHMSGILDAYERAEADLETVTAKWVATSTVLDARDPSRRCAGCGSPMTPDPRNSALWCGHCATLDRLGDY